MPSTISYIPETRDGLRCVLSTSKGCTLTVAGNRESAEPSSVEGNAHLQENPALINNLWAYGLHSNQYRRLRAEEKRESHRKQADHHEKVARHLGDLTDDRGTKQSQGWCSCCFELASHWRVGRLTGGSPTYLCALCGAPTTPCAVPRCKSFASAGTRAVSTPRYCAEHRHDINGFARIHETLGSLDDLDDWLKYEKRNAARTTKVATTVVLVGACVTPAALAAAPAIGGATGAMTGLSGAAATIHGLAMWGGGSLATGGLGMAGGTAVITTAGALLGGAIGGVTTMAYVRSDESFRIEKVKDGAGTPVLFATGFMTEGKTGWASWRAAVERRYPDNPGYQVHWGAKELKHISGLLTGAVLRRGGVAKLAQTAARATSKAQLGPLSAALAASTLVANPWHLAVSRADMTGTVLADILARTETEQFVLAGHSLGARVVARAAETLSLKAGPARLESVHLVGAALGADGDWRRLNDSVSSRAVAYISKSDQVLSRMYRLGQFGSPALGNRGFRSAFPRLVDVDLSKKVDGHSKYLEYLVLK